MQINLLSTGHPNAVSLTGPSVVALSAEWPGGRGWLSVEGLSVTGSACVSASLLGPGAGYLPQPGGGPIAADGAYAFDYPEGEIYVGLLAGSGETLTLQGLSLIG